MNTLRVGCAVADITPEIGTALSGFIARENKPSTRIEDPIFVRALVVDQEGEKFFLLNYEVLGFKPDMEEMLLAALESGLGADFSRKHCVLTTTHTHSAPPVAALEGETGVSPAYIRQICDCTVEAAQQALQQLRPAVLWLSAQDMEGFTYNRRTVLADGRVSIAYNPDLPMVERGELDKTFTLLVWKDALQPEQTLAAIAHFACHGVALCTSAVSGDIPGQIIQDLEQQLGAPCLFLQGASGDVNPTTVAGERPAMLEWFSRFRPHLASLVQQVCPVEGQPFEMTQTSFSIDFRPLPEREAVDRNLQLLEQVASGTVVSAEGNALLELLANIMNVQPGEMPDPAKAEFTARALANSERRVLEQIDCGQPLDPCPVKVKVWRMGSVVLVFMGAELFSITGRQVRALDPDAVVLPVTHAVPVVGYVPDAASMQKGGYEAQDAWRFYGQPAPFASDSEQRIVKAAAALVAKTGRKSS